MIIYLLSQKKKLIPTLYLNEENVRYLFPCVMTSQINIYNLVWCRCFYCYDWIHDKKNTRWILDDIILFSLKIYNIKI